MTDDDYYTYPPSMQLLIDAYGEIPPCIYYDRVDVIIDHILRAHNDITSVYVCMADNGWLAHMLCDYTVGKIYDNSMVTPVYDDILRYRPQIFRISPTSHPVDVDLAICLSADDNRCSTRYMLFKGHCSANIISNYPYGYILYG